MTNKILLIITGSIAAYKSMDLLRCLKKKDFDVTCILTESAQQFITPLLASSLSGNKTHTEIFSEEDSTGINHIQLSRQADLIVVAPATADFIAKLANGYAADLASSVILAANKKVILAPAMNEKMWDNAQTQRNLKNLVESDVSLVDPETDLLACGELGVGKMAAPEKICERVCEFFENKNRLEGKKILITGGSTLEPIDPVRFIGNHSSGKQAIEIAKVLGAMGADVTLVAGNIRESIPLPKEKIIPVKTAEEMFVVVKGVLLDGPRNKCGVTEGSAAHQDHHSTHQECHPKENQDHSKENQDHPKENQDHPKEHQDHSKENQDHSKENQDCHPALVAGSKQPTAPNGCESPSIDAFISCAAVADFKVKNFSNKKVKKTKEKNLTLELEKNPDILEFVGNSANRPKLVIGFAAESSDLEKYAQEKLQRKNCDLVVANDIESGSIFGSNETKVIFVGKNKSEDLGKISKAELAKLLAAKIENLLE